MTILQERVTLEEAVLGGMHTFPNGCNFRVLFDEKGLPWLEYGCDGVYVNLCQGHERLLYEWFRRKGEARCQLPISPEAIYELKTRMPCERCGSPFFKELK